jgi:hypothetical protein
VLDGGAQGVAAASAPTPTGTRSEPPSTDQLKGIANGEPVTSDDEGNTTADEPLPKDQQTHQDGGAQAHLGGEFTGAGEAPADEPLTPTPPEVIVPPEVAETDTLPKFVRPGIPPADDTDDDTDDGAVTNQDAGTNTRRGDDWKWETGGMNGGATDWFSGSIDDLIVGDTRQGPPEAIGPPEVDCGGQVFKGAFVNCPGEVPEVPPDAVTPLPGSDFGGEEDGCDKIELAAFSDCGLGDISKPDIFVPGGGLDLPWPTGCGPVGVIAICTGGQLGGTRDTATDPFRLDPAPVAPAVPVPPGSSRDLAG